MDILAFIVISLRRMYVMFCSYVIHKALHTGLETVTGTNPQFSHSALVIDDLLGDGRLPACLGVNPDSSPEACHVVFSRLSRIIDLGEDFSMVFEISRDSHLITLSHTAS